MVKTVAVKGMTLVLYSAAMSKRRVHGYAPLTVCRALVFGSSLTVAMDYTRPLIFQQICMAKSLYTNLLQELKDFYQFILVVAFLSMYATTWIS